MILTTTNTITLKGSGFMALAKEKDYTVEDIYNLPEGKRAELIDGQIYYMTPPNTTHQRISNYLSTEINLYIRSKNGSCEVFSAPFAVFLNEDNTTYVEPDISVICDKSKITKYGCVGSPDWIIEIVSPSSKQMDYLTKLFKYRTAGVREYWIIDALKNRIIAYNFETSIMEDYTFSDCIKVGIYEDFFINFAEISEILNF